MSLTNFQKEFLRLLIEKDTNVDDLEIQKINKHLEQLRIKHQSKVFNKKPNLEILSEHYPEIIAAMGSQDLGANLEEICFRTRLKEHKVIAILQSLINLEYVKLINNRYYYKFPAQSVEQLGSELKFESDFKRNLKKVEKKFDQSKNLKSSLFMVQTFCIRKSQKVMLRNKISEIIESFADESDDPVGDEVVEILVSFG